MPAGVTLHLEKFFAKLFTNLQFVIYSRSTPRPSLSTATTLIQPHYEQHHPPGCAPAWDRTYALKVLALMTIGFGLGCCVGVFGPAGGPLWRCAEQHSRRQASPRWKAAHRSPA